MDVTVDLTPREIRLLTDALAAKRPASPLLEKEVLDLVRKLAVATPR